MELVGQRDRNRAILVHALIRDTPATQTELARSTGLSKATVSRLIEDLVADGLAIEGGRGSPGHRGRTARPLSYNGHERVVCGVDMGGSQTRFLVADAAGRVIAWHRSATPTGASPGGLAGWLVDTIGSLVKAGDQPLLQTVIGVPGAVDPGEGIIRDAPNLPAVEAADFLATVRDRLGIATTFENDTNLALVGELHAGAAAGSRTAFMLTIGAGLGAAVALGGQLMRGRHGLVGEIGYLPFGERGVALESVLSGPGVLALAREHGLDGDRATTILGGPASPALRAVRAQLRQALRLAVTMAAISYDPELVVIGGGVAAGVEDDFAALQSDLARLTPEPPRVVRATLRDRSGVIGATVSAMHTVFRDAGLEDSVMDDLPGRSILDDLLRGLPEPSAHGPRRSNPGTPGQDLAAPTASLRS